MSGPEVNKYSAPKCEHCGKYVKEYGGVRIACDEVGIPHAGRKSKWVVVHDYCWEDFTAIHKYNSSSKKPDKSMQHQETLFPEDKQDINERIDSIENRLTELEKIILNSNNRGCD